MKNAKTKGSKTTQTTKAEKPEADLRPAIDPALLDGIGWFVDDPEAWFRTPNVIFGGRAPIELLGTPDEARLRNSIEAAKYGQYS